MPLNGKNAGDRALIPKRVVAGDHLRLAFLLCLLLSAPRWLSVLELLAIVRWVWASAQCKSSLSQDQLHGRASKGCSYGHVLLQQYWNSSKEATEGAPLPQSKASLHNVEEKALSSSDF